MVWPSSLDRLHSSHVGRDLVHHGVQQCQPLTVKEHVAVMPGVPHRLNVPFGKLASAASGRARYVC